MDRHGPIHVGEGQAVALIGEDHGGVRWRTRDKAAHGDRRLTPGAAPNEAIRDRRSAFDDARILARIPDLF
jgi:hypothetical protein